MSVTAVVDDREPAGVVAALRDHPDVRDVEVRRLAAGDLSLGPVGVERKTGGDYLASAFGHGGSDLRDQVERLAASYEHAYVLVEGDLDEVEAVRPGVAGASVRGSMASITARLGVPVVPCGDRERLVDMAVRLTRKHSEEPGRRPLPPGAVPGRAEPVAKRMYACIEGVGPATAAALHEAFPTVESLVAATREDLLAVEGVGEHRAEAVLSALRSPD